jgi:hypothetical protein
MSGRKYNTLFKDNRSQAALEFLTTYAWAFIVIMITMGGLYYYGIFDFDKYLPQKCNFPSQFKCLDFALQPDEIHVKLLNNLGEDLLITSFPITDDAGNTIACASMPPLNADWAAGQTLDFDFTSCSAASYVPGQRINLKLSFEFFAKNTPSRPLHRLNGNVNGIVTTS